jgi:hypothetical protein
VRFYFADVCGDACCGAGLECGSDRAEYFSVGVLSYAVGTADVFMDETEGARAIGQEGMTA